MEDAISVEYLLSYLQGDGRCDHSHATAHTHRRRRKGGRGGHGGKRVVQDQRKRDRDGRRLVYRAKAGW